jgi:hypothetical protein
MNKPYSNLLAIIVVFIAFEASAQSLEDYNQQSNKYTRQGMLILGSWALINIASSPIMSANSTGSDKYFHQMNGLWNSVNLIIAGFGYYQAMTSDVSALSLSESLAEQSKIEKTLLFNAGLDLAYMAGGLYLLERSKSQDSDRLKGYGQSIIMQGAFLFAFDLILYSVHAHHSDKLLQFVEKLALSPYGIGFRFEI